MKKYIIGGALMFSLFFVSSAKAATIDDSITLQTQYQQALTQLIGLLLQQLKDLQAQLAAVQDTQATVATQVQQMVQNTTPVDTPSFGNILSPSQDIVPNITYIDATDLNDSPAIEFSGNTDFVIKKIAFKANIIDGVDAILIPEIQVYKNRDAYENRMVTPAENKQYDIPGITTASDPDKPVIYTFLTPITGKYFRIGIAFATSSKNIYSYSVKFDAENSDFRTPNDNISVPLSSFDFGTTIVNTHQNN